jgi:hypothetical protein
MKSNLKHQALWPLAPLNGRYANTGTIATTLGLRRPIVTLIQARLTLSDGLKVNVSICLLLNGLNDYESSPIMA